MAPSPAHQAQWTVGALRRHAAELLRRSQRIEPREATHLLAHLLTLSEAQVLSGDERLLSSLHVETLFEQLRRRLDGEPFAYIVGSREFYGRSFHVDSRVLIPRPETEHLVEQAIGLELRRDAVCLDVGVGSGCIAITLALECPQWKLYGSDRSVAALRVAQINRRRFDLERRLSLVAGDLFGGLDPRCFDLVVANPPYVDRAEGETLQPEVRDWEPGVALFAEEHGLAAYRRLLDAARHLSRGAYLLLELGAGQRDAVLGMSGGSFATCKITPDYGGIDRVVLLRRR